MRRIVVPVVVAVMVCGLAARSAHAQTEQASPPPAPAIGTASGPDGTATDNTSTDNTSTSSTAAASGDDHGWAVRFLRDVGGDYKHFFSKETAVWLGVGGGAAAGVHAADQWLADRVQESDPAELTGGATYGSQWLHIPVAMAWWVVGAAAGSERNAEAGRDLLRAQLSVVSWTYAIKVTANRTRPNGDPHSFPSGHASTSFATAMVLQEHYGWKLGLPAFALATYTGVSRVIANQHWASDVVFGAFVGMASGRTVTLHLRTTRVSLAPFAVPGGKGVLVTVLRPS